MNRAHDRAAAQLLREVKAHQGTLDTRPEWGRWLILVAGLVAVVVISFRLHWLVVGFLTATVLLLVSGFLLRLALQTRTKVREADAKLRHAQDRYRSYGPSPTKHANHVLQAGARRRPNWWAVPALSAPWRRKKAPPPPSAPGGTTRGDEGDRAGKATSEGEASRGSGADGKNPPEPEKGSPEGREERHELVGRWGRHHADRVDREGAGPRGAGAGAGQVPGQPAAELGDDRDGGVPEPGVGG